METRRPPAQADRVDRPHRHRQDDEQVADVEPKRREQRRRSPATGSRARPPATRRRRPAATRDSALAQEQPRDRDDHHRDERIEDHAVGRGRVVEAEIGERVVRADAERAQERASSSSARARCANRARTCGHANGARIEQREEPAKERHRHRRNVAVRAAADDPVAGPEERRQRKQQVRVAHRAVRDSSFTRAIIACTAAPIDRMVRRPHLPPRIIRARFALLRADGHPSPPGRRPRLPAQRSRHRTRTQLPPRPRPPTIAATARKARRAAPLVPRLPAPGRKSRARRALPGSVRRAGARAARARMRAGRSACSRSSAPTRSPRSASPTRSRGSRRALRVALLPDWETLPYDHFSPHQDLVSERLATLYRVSRGECDVLVVAATTALYRLAPPSYLAAFTFFLKQGDAARRRRAARAACARRLPARHAGRLARRVQRPRRPDRSLSDGQRAALPARSLRRRHREHQDLRRRHAAHALSGARRAAAAGARVSARRSGPHALSQPLSRGVRGRSVEVAAVQGHEQRRRAGRHRVLPAAVLRGDGDARRLSAARRRRRAARRRRRRGRAVLAGHRFALQAAARRQGAAAAAARRSVPAARRVQRRAEGIRAHRIRRRSIRMPMPAGAEPATRTRAPRRCRRCRSTAARRIRSPRSSASSRRPATRAC